MPEHLRVRARPELFVEMNRAAPRRRSPPREGLRSLPPLLKGYVRAGCCIGDGAVIDRQFGTTDVFIYFPLSGIDARYKSAFRVGEVTVAASALLTPAAQALAQAQGARPASPSAGQIKPNRTAALPLRASSAPAICVMSVMAAASPAFSISSPSSLRPWPPAARPCGPGPGRGSPRHPASSRAAQISASCTSRTSLACGSGAAMRAK